MIISKSLKVFVEPDEEIVFILEKIMNSPSNRIILIVPNTAILISSGLSLKLLSKQLVNSPKLVVIVCENEGVIGLGEKAGLIITRKVSEVSKDLWIKAKELKELLNSDLVRTKNELLGQRQEPLELHETLPDDGVLEERTEPQERPVKAVIVDEPEIVVPVSVVKPRLKGRVIDVGKLKIYSGGDILENRELVKLERERNNPEKVIDLTGPDEKEDQGGSKSSGLIG